MDTGRETTAPPNPAAAAGEPAEPGRADGPFVLRIAGLPVETLRELRCPGSRRWADSVLRETDRLRAEGEAVGDRLHDLVGGHPAAESDTVRRGLLKLRREVYNNRLPRDGDAALALVAGVDGAAGEALAGWLRDRRRLEEQRTGGAALLAGETARSRAALRRLAEEERLRKGLLLASPALDAQLDGRLRAADGGTAGDSPGGPPGKKQRKIERSLLSYLYRTVCKTSPFSTFTGVALGELAEGDGRHGGDSALTVRAGAPWTGHARLNVAALGRLAETVLADPARRADLPVSPASGWGREADRVRYVRRWVTEGDEDTAVTFDAVKDRLFFLRRTGTLERLLGLFEERGTVRYGELSAWLAADRGASAEECDRYLEALLRIGMVQVPCLRTEVHDTDPLRAFQRSLRGLDRPWAARLADRLGGPVSLVDRFAAAEPAARRTLLTELRRELIAVQEELGSERAKVPQTVLYEDAAAGRSTTLDAAAWTELAAGPLGAVERILPAFDLTLPQRITFKGFFLARFGQGGRCDDLLKLVHDFHEDFFDQYMTFTAGHTSYDADGRYVPEVNWLGLPQLKALDTARQTFTERMRGLWEARDGAGGRDGAAAAGGEIVLDEALIDEIAAELAPVAPDFAPMSHHVQIADRPADAGGPLLVLNRSYGGLSFPFSRFTHCFDGLEQRLLRAAGEVCPEGAVFAEVTGGPVTSNLNLHGRLTEYEIVCPGETGTLPEEFRLGLDDLSVEHDESADRLVLRSARLGREVIPVYLGYLVPLALPELPRTLLLLSPTSMAPLNVWGGVPESEPVDGVTARPRVRHGGLVLSRRSWSAPASALPERPPGQSEADRFLEWHRFRRAHGLPDRVFATVSDSGARGATGAKPQYLDFDSPLSLAAFEALVKSPGARVVFREALPDEDELHTVSGRGRHVAELAVETAVAPARTRPRSSTR
ncbi:lantibiotic dehydratase [Streptomyces xinghaiensis]|uniref:lantibiotic dehydratase n=1 Tax=Streptomyces xinghaiensis TaxID=1038928 RepID=UPI000BAF571F|nr:lantibiotic dehydratase [Streptomyces xinghaiensis]